MDMGTKVILGGDLNAKHPAWNSYTENAAGLTIYEHTKRRLDIQIKGPTEPTRRQSSSEDVVDIFVHKNVRTNNKLEVIMALNSDHLPVVQIMDEKQSIELPTNIKKHDWKKFKQLTGEIMTKIRISTTTEEIEEEMKNGPNR